MNPIVYAIPVFMLTIVAEVWVAQRRNVPTYDIADAITSLHFGVLSQVSGAFTKIFTFGIYVWVFESARLLTLPSDAVWVWVAALLAYDFLYYWVHRAGHEVNLIWASHQVHHSSEWYNLSTALRQTSTGALFVWPLYLPMAILGVPPLVFGAVALIDLLYQYWVHTELVGKLGWLDRVFVTPSNHRVHHGQNDWCIDRNYGGILILWDRLFGTFAEERDDERVVYGIRKPLASYDPLWGNLHVYRDIWRAARAESSWGAAFKRWFAKPAGDGPLPHLDPRSVRRFAPPNSPAALGYATLQYALLVPIVTHFIAVAPSLSLAARSTYALVILASAVGIGGWLEGKAGGVVREVLRVIAVAATVLALPEIFAWSNAALVGVWGATSLAAIAAIKWR
jgi:sterol desaturase/sphingolipid hydroxylase (fatty acid hydroxylase superfamily)